MTIHIGKRFVLAVVAVLLIAAAGAVGYKLGGDSKDDDAVAAVKAAKARAKAAQADAYERGRAKGDSEGRGAIVDEENSQEGVDHEVITYLGYDRPDWKDGRYYIVHIAIRGGSGLPKYPSVFDRQSMSPGLYYYLCGDDNSALCYLEQ